MREKALLGFLSLALIACTNTDGMEQTKSATTNLAQSIDSETIIDAGSDFDWNRALRLKAKLLQNLANQSARIDWLLSGFLNEYSDIVNDINNYLYNRDDYDSISTIVYKPEDQAEAATVFAGNVERSGFEIATAEGEIVIVQSTDFIKKDILIYMDSISAIFLDLYCAEIDSVCCSDGALIISNKTLLNRVYEWGELLKEMEYSEYYSMVQNKYNWNLFFMLNGLENTPFFDWESALYDQEVFNLIQDFMEKYPNSTAANDFKIFSELLVANGMKKTEKVSQFLEEMYNNILTN